MHTPLQAAFRAYQALILIKISWILHESAKDHDSGNFILVVSDEVFQYLIVITEIPHIPLRDLHILFLERGA